MRSFSCIAPRVPPLRRWSRILHHRGAGASWCICRALKISTHRLDAPSLRLINLHSELFSWISLCLSLAALFFIVFDWCNGFEKNCKGEQQILSCHLSSCFKKLGEKDWSVTINLFKIYKIIQPFRKSIERFHLGIEQEAFDTEGTLWKLVYPTLIGCSRNQTVLALWNISICPCGSNHVSLEIKKLSEIEHVLVVLAHFPLCKYDI